MNAADIVKWTPTHEAAKQHFIAKYYPTDKSDITFRHFLAGKRLLWLQRKGKWHFKLRSR
jgi:hypothetical protein